MKTAHPADAILAMIGSYTCQLCGTEHSDTIEGHPAPYCMTCERLVATEAHRLAAPAYHNMLLRATETCAPNECLQDWAESCGPTATLLAVSSNGREGIVNGVVLRKTGVLVRQNTVSGEID